MLIENEFVVKAPIETVWDYMLDVERVAPCMPGAELTEVVDDRTWKGLTRIKVGPVNLSFTGKVVMEERDDQNHRVRLKAEGREQRGKGAASAKVTSRMEGAPGGTKVMIETDLTITGAIAQYGRGMMMDISQRLTNQFAGCLEQNIVASQAPPATPSPTGSSVTEPAPPPAATAAPVKGLRLGLWALWRAVARFFKRLFGGDRAR
jgi:uncharacterized protein